MTSDPPARLVASYLVWAGLRGALAKGYWLVTGLYLVLVAGLSPWQLILIGTFQAVTVLVAEVPAGVLADTVSRRLSLTIGHVVMGSGMAMAGLVTGFPALVASQCLWGLGWAFSSGADVAWITDELDQRDRIDQVLVAQARWDLLGSAVGLAAFGALAAGTSLRAAIVTSGLTMIGLGLAGVARWPETGFDATPRGGRWREARTVLRDGLSAARADRVIVAVLVATFLIEGGNEAWGRLFERRMLSLGLSADENVVVWFAALSLVGLMLGALVLRIVNPGWRVRAQYGARA